MALRLKERLGKKFDEEIRFFKGMMQGPKTVGSIVPTSSITARKMASVIHLNSGLPVLELGPGTGAITKAILGRGVKPENLVAIEYSTDFYEHLVRLYPSVRFINGDAFDLDKTLGDLKDQTFDSVVSAVPLLNFPMQARIALLESLLEPDSGRQAGRADFLWSGLADHCAAGALPHPAFRFHRPQYPAGAALDLPTQLICSGCTSPTRK